MSNWTFSIRWLGEDHILLSFTKDELEYELPIPVNEYAQFMELAQTFNFEFKERLDEQILKHYTHG